MSNLSQDTGNYYYGARYYDPKVSVWLSVDPKADAFPSVTPYSVMMNNPIMMIDPGGDSTFIFNEQMEPIGMVPDDLENAIIVVGQDGVEGVDIIMGNVEKNKKDPEKLRLLGESARDHSKYTYFQDNENKADGIPIDIWLQLEGRNPFEEYRANALKALGLGSANTIVRGQKPNVWALAVSVILSGCVTGENMMNDYYKSMSPKEIQKRRSRTKEFKERYQPEGYSE